MKKTVLWLLIFYWSFWSFGRAQSTNYSQSLGTSWLQISPSTCYVGMGDSALAVSDAYDEADINPAGLGLVGGTFLSLSQNFYAQGISAQHLIFTQAVTGGDGFSLGANYINFGNIDTYNVVGNGLSSTGNYSPIGLNLYAAYGMGLGDGLRMGFTGHFIYDNIQKDFPDQTGALDAGIYFRMPDRPFSFSAVMSNLGWNIDDSTLPFQIKTGGAYQILFGPETAPQRLTFSGEVDTYLYDGNYAQVGIGGEYWYRDLISLRAGYQFSKIGDLSGLDGLSLGAGVKYLNWQLDYALITLGELGVANQISLSIKLGDNEKPKNTPTFTPTPVNTPVFTPTATAPPTVIPPATNSIASPTPMPALQIANDHFVVYYDLKSKKPKDEDYELLDSLAAFLKDHLNLLVIIDGYSDNQGSKFANNVMSLDRAIGIKNYLIQKGIPPQNVIEVKGYGASNPGMNNNTQDQAQNRRVVIRWINAEQLAQMASPKSGISDLSGLKWWGNNFNVQIAFKKLIDEIVPDLINKNNLFKLGYCRQLFFNAALKEGVSRLEFLQMDSGYYTAVAQNLFRLGYVNDADFYNHLALFYQPQNADALTLQSEIKNKIN